MARTRPINTLEQAIAWARQICPKNGSRPALAAVLADPAGVTASDGYRMRHFPWPDASSARVLHLADGSVVPDGTNGIRYPDFSRVLPAEDTRIARVPLHSDALAIIRLHAGAAAGAAVADRSAKRSTTVPMVRLRAWGDALRVWAVYDSLAPLVTYTQTVAFDVPDCMVAIDARYMLSAIGGASMAVLDIHSPSAPVIIRGVASADAWEAIMPMSVEWGPIPRESA